MRGGGRETAETCKDHGQTSRWARVRTAKCGLKLVWSSLCSWWQRIAILIPHVDLKAVQEADRLGSGKNEKGGQTLRPKDRGM